VISIFTSFGYFEDPAENQRVLENNYRSLRPGGRFLLDIMGKEVLARIFQARDWSEHNGLFWLQERQPLDNWSRLQVRWILLSEGQRREFLMQHWLYSAAELAAMFYEAGFDAVSVYGGLDGRPYDQEARRLLVVGRKN
jgi:SAM-dependent methyltransferase